MILEIFHIEDKTIYRHLQTIPLPDHTTYKDLQNIVYSLRQSPILNTYPPHTLVYRAKLGEYDTVGMELKLVYVSPTTQVSRPDDDIHHDLLEDSAVRAQRAGYTELMGN